MNTIKMIRVAAAVPKLRVANPTYNSKEILKHIESASKHGAGVIVFPALCLTGATCGDLFFQDTLYEKQLQALNEILASTKNIDSAVILGLYFRIDNCLIEAAVLMQKGIIRGIVPRFTPASCVVSHYHFQASITKKINLPNVPGSDIPFGRLLFTDKFSGLSLGIEVSEDALSAFNSDILGAHIVLNPASGRKLIGSSDQNLRSILEKSRKNVSAVVRCCSGLLESSTTGLYSGDCIIAENGKPLDADFNLSFDGKIVQNDIDYGYLMFRRSKDQACPHHSADSEIYLSPLPELLKDTPFLRTYNKKPFIPENRALAFSNCKEAFDIQSMALARRLIHTNSHKAVIGVSGGLDSTLALIITARAMKILKRPFSDIIAVTMPGFGTSDQTYKAAIDMMEALGTEIKEIPIKDAVLLHFKDIGHDPENKNTVYENVQARERTQILMNISNMVGGMQIGTGDLSEIALGFSTFNGDHMSMYNVNAGVPKTFIRLMLRWFIEDILKSEKKLDNFCSDDDKLASALSNVLDIPVSPELLPLDGKNAIVQKTEEQIGPYVLHDFFLYHTIRRGTPPEKLHIIAMQTFEDEYDAETIKKWLKLFYKRFFIHQFKRGCAPDSPKIGTVSLSPKGDWQMPSDGDVGIWINDLES